MAIVLGIGVRTGAVPEDFELCSRLAFHTGLAGRRRVGVIPSWHANPGAPCPELRLVCLRKMARNAARHGCGRLRCILQHFSSEAATDR